MKSFLEILGARLEPHPDPQYKGMLLISETEQLYFSMESLVEIESVLKENFTSVKSYLQNKIGPLISELDVNYICFKIISDYHRQLSFGKQGKKKDMKTVIYRDGTNLEYRITEIALYYFRQKYPDRFFEPLQAFTGMKKKDLEEYITGRDEFYNK